MIICQILIISLEIFKFHCILLHNCDIVTISWYHINVKPPAISFLRTHAPEKYGDDLSSFRFTVVKVNKEGKSVRGVELGRAGLSIRGVAPIRYLGQIVGSVEFGTSFNIEAEIIKNLNLEDMAVLLHKSFKKIAWKLKGEEIGKGDFTLHIDPRKMGFLEKIGSYMTKMKDKIRI